MKTLQCDWCGAVAPGVDWFTLARNDDGVSIIVPFGDHPGPWHFDRMECLTRWAGRSAGLDPARWEP